MLTVSLIVPLVIAIGVGAAIFAGSKSEQAMTGALAHVSQSHSAFANSQVAGAMAEMNRALELARTGGTAAKAVDSPLTSTGVAQALKAYKEAVGVQALSAMELTLHDTHSSIDVQSPKNAEHVDEYDYRDGSVSGPEPVRLVGHEKSNLKASLFDPEKTALLKLDQLKLTALQELKYESAKVSHVIMRRDRGKTEILVYGSDARDSGYVRFDEKGKVVRVYR